ncbi:DUF11 domain-containing protein [Corallococcus macrosporus]|uniref:DUF11 domain-containing protein n=1 Tax=Corallococcus macrosporus TaxID=35 RepID=A0ABS3D7T5_9BACT|nr:DUF11 domain-containing protein [Corallococcus macrosporus]MBN8226712.1 DUF11 domain-containing protein [Corallococcus macrosporus]
MLLFRGASVCLFLALTLAGVADAGVTARAVPSAARHLEQPDLPPALRGALEKSLYRIQDYRSSNPAQGFGVTFTDAGLHLAARGPSAGSWQWHMSLRGYGYGEQMQPVAAAERVVRDNRIGYLRGPLTEEYVNTRQGLEQRFTLATPPAGRMPGEALVLRLGVSGPLRAVLQADPEKLAFVDANGERVLSHGRLAAIDARGHRLPARMRLVRDEVRLEVDDRGAAYPVSLDLLIATEQAKLTASDAGAESYFGFSVSLSGDTAIVGAPFHDTAAGESAGSVYVFVRSGTTWSEQAKLIPSDAGAGNAFGFSVSLSGDTAVIGAPGHETATGVTGTAYVFVRSGTTWSQLVELTPSDSELNMQFGWSVVLSGDTALVSAVSISGDNSSSGAAYVFVRGGTTWSQQAKLTPSDPVAFEQFSWSVALSGDTALVGALSADANTGAGAAHVFVRSGTTWSEQAKLTISDPVSGRYFGESVAISGDTALVGARSNVSYAGAAYVFVRSGTTWSEQAKLTANDSGASDLFGFSVAISGDTALVGAPYVDESIVGAAYVFVRSGTTWLRQEKLTVTDAANGESGWSVALSGDTALVGARSEDLAAGPAAGSARVYVLLSDANADLQLSKQASPAPEVLTGQDVTYTLTLTNKGPATATNVVVTDTLPASTTFVSCSADQGGSCGGAGRNRGIHFASLAPSTTATITLVARVNCDVADGTSIINSATVSSDTPDGAPGNNTATVLTRASNPAPMVTSSVATSSLWPPNSKLLDVGLKGHVKDNCPGATLQVSVFGDEDDQTLTSPGVVHSPDARDIAPGTLRLRAERVVGGNGRVYLIVLKATDSGGKVGVSVQTVVVPGSQCPADLDSVKQQAAAARAYALAHNGNPPPGYFAIGEPSAPVIGPKQ